MEGVHRLEGITAKIAVCQAGEVAQVDQPLLHISDLRAGHAFLQGGEGIHRTPGNRARGGDRRHAVQTGLGVIARHAVGLQAVLLLEGLDGRHIVRLAHAVGIRVVIAQGRQALLQADHRLAAYALLDQHHIVLGHGRVAGLRRGRTDGNGGHRRRRGSGQLPLGQRVIAEQHLAGGRACRAIIIQAVLPLEFPQRGHAALPEQAVRLAGQVAQLLEALLHQGSVGALAALLHRALRKLEGGRGGGLSSGLWGGGGRGGQGVGAQQAVLRIAAAHAVHGQAVLLLERLHRVTGGGIVYAGDFPVIIAQLLQPGLHGAHLLAPVIEADGHALHGGQGFHIRLDSLGVLRLSAVQEGLQIHVNNAGGGIFVLLLERNHRAFGARAELSVRAAGEEAQLHERLLQCRDGAARGPQLQQLVAGSVGLRGHGGLGHRRGGGLDDGFEIQVILHAVAGQAVVIHLGKGAGHLLHRDHRALGNGGQPGAPGGLLLPQVHAVAGGGFIGIAGSRQLRGGGGGGRSGRGGNILLDHIAGAILIGYFIIVTLFAQHRHGSALADTFQHHGGGGRVAPHIHLIVGHRGKGEGFRHRGGGQQGNQQR